jgi:4-amino-4-deoxy-L-arabinose transferase-like glycosyltransferase
MKEFLQKNFTLAIILTVSVFLAIYRLNECNLTMDEFFSINVALRPLSEIWDFFKGHPNLFYFNRSAPLYETILHFFIGKGNPNILVARLLSIFLHALTLFYIFKISKLLFDRHTALLAVFFAALNYGYIFYSKMIRWYVLSNLLVILSFYLFIKIAKENAYNRKYYISLLLVNISVLYTVYFGSFIIAMEIILAPLLIPRKNLLKILSLLVAAFFLFLPWIKHLGEDIKGEKSIQFYFNYFMQLPDLIRLRLQHGIFRSNILFIIYTAIFICLALYSTVKLFRKKDMQSRWLISLILVVVIPALSITFLTARVYADYTRARYFLSFIFPLFILAGFLVRRIIKPLAILVFFMLSFFSIASVTAGLLQPSDKFWPAGLASVSISAKNFAIPKGDKVIIEMEDAFFVPIFAYYFFGGQYMCDVSFPYCGSNIKKICRELKPDYSIFFDSSGIKEKQRFDSIANLMTADWLFLIYSDWFIRKFGKSYIERYNEKLRLRDLNMNNPLTLVHKEHAYDFTLEVYKINKSQLQ